MTPQIYEKLRQTQGFSGCRKMCIFVALDYGFASGGARTSRSGEPRPSRGYIGNMEPVKQSFPPMVGDAPAILILGSLPGEESLRRQEYYAKLQNRFWPLMARLTDSPLPQTYAEKRAMLAAHRIALWDVVRAAERKGSADTDIRREAPNDIPGLLRRCPTIHTVVFNGKTAANLFQKHFPQLELSAVRQVRFIVRLSTSPANCQFSEEEMYRNWREVFEG